VSGNRRVDAPSGRTRGRDLATARHAVRNAARDLPLGTVRDIAPVPIPWKAGTPTLGGPLVTGGGLVFIGATMDHYLRAFDVQTGEEIWKSHLDAGAIATPMTYRARPGGKQYVLIAAGGHARSGVGLGDALVAFALRD
jgi:quinoprotein glucose dehydrogenase